MPAPLQTTGVSSDALVAAQAVPNMTVKVDAGSVLVGGTPASFAATNLTIAAADPVADRTDAIVCDSSGNLSVITGPINDGINPAPPDTTGYALLAYVTVLNQGSPSYTGTIVAGAVIDKRALLASTSGQLALRTVHTSGTGATHTFAATTATVRIIVVGGGGGGGGTPGCHATDGSAAAAGGGGGGAADVVAAI